jgi:FkbM family methyltransferase
MVAEVRSLQSVVQQTHDLAPVLVDFLSEQRADQARLQGLATPIAQLLSEQRANTSRLEGLTTPIAQLLSEHRASDALLAALNQTNHDLGLNVGKTTEYAALAANYANKLLQGRALALGDEVLVRSPFGWLLLPSDDLALIQAMMEMGGLLEPGTIAVMQALLEPGYFAVDVGAHLGTLSLAMARSVAPAGHVLAIEPTPRTAALLRRTCALAGLEHIVQVEGCAAGARDSTATLSTVATSGHNSLLPLERATSRIEVEVRPLDSVLPSAMVPALVKIDAEGFELEVWRGMERLVRETPDLAVIVEFGPSHLQRSGVTIEAWFAALTAPGFTPWEIDEASGTIRPLRPSGLESIFSMNVLLLRHPPSHWPRLRIAA